MKGTDQMLIIIQSRRQIASMTVTHELLISSTQPNQPNMTTTPRQIKPFTLNKPWVTQVTTNKIISP